MFSFTRQHPHLSPVGIYLLKVGNRNTRTRCEICSKLTRKTPELRYGVVLVFLDLNLNNFTPCSSVSIVNFEHVIAGWEVFVSVLNTPML